MRRQGEARGQAGRAVGLTGRGARGQVGLMTRGDALQRHVGRQAWPRVGRV